MKKLISLFLVAVLILAVPSAYCEQMTFQDFADQLSDDTLFSLAVFLQSEAVRRFGESFELPAGVYTVGIDIPYGNWTVTVVGKVTAEFILYKNKQAQSDGMVFPLFDELLNESFGTPTIGKIELNDGNVVEISGKVRFTPYNGLYALQP